MADKTRYAGLKWQCGTIYLEKVLPFLARVLLVQDGVYYRVEMDPQHEVSQLLITVFGERYIEWADKQMKTVVREIENNATSKQIQALDAGAQAALSSVKSSDTVPMKQLLETLVIVDVKHLKEIVETTNTQQQKQQQHHALVVRQSIGLRQNPPTTGATRARRVELCPLATLVPYFPPELPETMQILFEEHLQYKLEKFKGVSKKGWGKGLAMGLSRRSYLYRLIVAKLSCSVPAMTWTSSCKKLRDSLMVNEGPCLSTSSIWQRRKATQTRKRGRSIQSKQGGRKRSRRISRRGW
jgi:hypothetical protein